jgi:hypothetical protein
MPLHNFLSTIMKREGTRCPLAADPDRRERFLKEARAASALNHPHVCIVYDVGETEEGLPFIARHPPTSATRLRT